MDPLARNASERGWERALQQRHAVRVLVYGGFSIERRCDVPQFAAGSLYR
jgi:hypothetical protein